MNLIKATIWIRAAPPFMAFCCAAIGLGLADRAAALEVQPSARLHLDYAAYNADTKPLEDGWMLRRAVIGVEGKFNDDWDFEVGYNIDSDGNLRPADGGFRDVSVTYEGWSAGDIRFGQFKLPFGLEELTSSNNTSFIERALPVDAFAPSRRMGVGFIRGRDSYTFSAMGFGSSIDGDDRGSGVAARFTLAPLHTRNDVLHFGAALVAESPRSKVDFDTAPESRVADEDLVNTGRIDGVDKIYRYGLESAWRSGPWSVQAEWMGAQLQRNLGLAEANVHGWYVAGSWVLTGEMRQYKNGEFKGVVPAATRGSWELTARYSRINLDDADIRGGQERNISLGLNYYKNKHLRIMLNYIQVHSQRRGLRDNPNMLLLRAQVVL